MSDILKFVSDNSDRILDDIGYFVSRETPSTDKSSLDEFSDFLAGYAADLGGGDAELVRAETSGNHVVLRVAGNGNGSSESPVLMVGHYDTVWPLGTIESMPFAIQDSYYAHGPGIFDMKTGLVQGLWAIRALHKTNAAHPPIVFIFNSDEEIGSPESRDLITEQARVSQAALVLEPSFEGALKTERKGVGRYRLRVQGKASHAGLAPEAGISAIDEMAHLILDLHAETNFDTGTTVNVGVVNGGTRYNVVAEAAFAEVDLRIAGMDEARRMDGFIKSLRARHPEANVSVEGGILWPPMKRNALIGNLFDTAARVGAENCGVVLREASVGGASDGCTCAAAGIPVLDGLGAVGDGAHATHEYIDIRYIPQRTALVAHLLSTFPG